MKVTIWLNDKPRTYNADEVDIHIFPDGGEDEPRLESVFMLRDTLDGDLLITGEIPLMIQLDESKNKIILSQPIPE